MPFNLTSESLFTVILFLVVGTIPFWISLPYVLMKNEEPLESRKECHEM